MKTFIKTLNTLIFALQTVYLFLKISYIGEKNVSRISFLVFLFANLLFKFISFFFFIYLKFWIIVYNMIFYWPFGFLKNCFYRLNFILRLYLYSFIILIFLFIYLFHNTSINIFLNVQQQNNIFIEFFNPMLSLNYYALDKSFINYLDFVDSHFSFLRNLEIDKTFYKFFYNEDKDSSNNLFLHKAYFSDFVRSKYLVHTMHNADWHHFQFGYARGWLNNVEIFDIVSQWSVLKSLIFFKDLVIFLIFKLTPSDSFFIIIKYYILENYVLIFFFDPKYELIFFKLVILIFPDFFLLNLGFSYKFIFIVVFDYIFDHIESFILKLIKIMDIGPGNYVLKKKLMKLSTDFKRLNFWLNKILEEYLYLPRLVVLPSRKRAEINQAYPFLLEIPTDLTFDSMRMTFLPAMDRTIFGNVIEMTPFVEEKYNIYTQTGYTNPRSHDFYSGTSGLYDLSDNIKPNYRLSEWDLWYELNVHHDFFSKNYYYKDNIKKDVFTSLINSNNVFFGGDKSILVKDIPKEIGWFFKGPFSFGMIDLNYTHSINTLDNTNLLKNRRITTLNTNLYINTRFRTFLRTDNVLALDIYPQYFDVKEKYFEEIKGKPSRFYKYKSMIRRQLILETKDVITFLTSPMKDIILTTISSNARYFFMVVFSYKGDFYFGNQNYTYGRFLNKKSLVFNYYDIKKRKFLHSRSYDKDVSYITDLLYLDFYPRHFNDKSNLKYKSGIGFKLRKTELNKIDNKYGIQQMSAFFLVHGNFRYKYVMKVLFNFFNNKNNKIHNLASFSLLPLVLPHTAPYPLESMYFNNGRNLNVQDTRLGSSFDFYDLFVNSLLENTFLSHEMGKMLLNVEANVPYYRYKRHLQYSYNLRFSSILTFFFFFIRLFLDVHLVFFFFFFFS
jgi:hypothetical protein